MELVSKTVLANATQDLEVRTAVQVCLNTFSFLLSVIFCLNNLDCSNNGVCTEGTCNCNEGYSGDTCSIVAPILTPIIDPAEYRYSLLTLEDMEIYWKIEKDQIEVAMRAPIAGWIGIGLGKEMADSGFFNSK